MKWIYFILIIVGLIYFGASPLFPDQEVIQLLSALAFWYGTTYLVLTSPLRNALRLVASWGWRGVLLLSSYLVVHYFVYGLLLERILGVRGVEFLGVTYTPLNTFSLKNYVLLLYSPSIVMGNGGLFLDLSFFSLVMGLLIGVVVVGSVIGLLKVKASIKRNSWIVSLPLLGVLAGGTCCLSLGGIVADFGLSVLATSGSIALIEGPIDAIYFGLPLLTFIFLWSIFRTMNQMNSKFESKY